VNERVELADPPEDTETLAGLRERLGPVGELVAESETLPAKPLRLEIVMVDRAVEPGLADRLLGLADMLKSGDAVD
jgi:hypothetical protein